VTSPAEQRAASAYTELARLDPAAAFSAPEDVRDHARLTTEEKIDILGRWAYDESEIAVAVEEGMRDTGRPDLLRRILLALSLLAGDVDLERTAPTKHHGLALPPGNDYA
jgi:hypothetical protein